MKFKILKFKKVKSTNDTALRIIKKTNIKNGMIIADSQYKGRGRYGRKWISYKGNLFVSFFYCLQNINLTIKQLTILNCLLVKKLISIYYKKEITYKKPNDLLIEKKKISGILQETVDKLGVRYLIVGIGINLSKNPYIKGYPTTNLNYLVNKKLSKKNLENNLKIIFENKLSKFYEIK